MEEKPLSGGPLKDPLFEAHPWEDPAPELVTEPPPVTKSTSCTEAALEAELIRDLKICGSLVTFIAVKLK